jgi:hypothetical protein
MAGQLDRLLAITDGLSQVSFGIVPFGVQLHFAPRHGFLLFDDDLAVVETLSGQTIHRGEEAAAYARAMDHLAAQALTGRDARRLIAEVQAALRPFAT